MKKLLGILLIVISILASIYLGVWVMFIGGIIQIINEVKAEQLIALNVAIGVAKIVFCEIAGLIAYIGCFLGFRIMKYKRRR